MQTQAQVVIIGAGIVGCSAAYHLTQLGWRDVVVIDQGPLFETGGSTSHAPGITFGTNPSLMMTRMSEYTVRLLDGLAFEGEQVWYKVGTLEVATTEERVQELWRRHGTNTAYGVENYLISPQEVKELVPIIDETVLRGGLYRPNDGNTKAWKAAGAMGQMAMAEGATFYGGVTATDFELEQGRIKAVVTDKGRIECEHVLLCTNIWGSVLADKLGVTLPFMACAHHYAITEPLPELAGETRWIYQPPVRLQERAMYFRQWDDAYCTGSYRHEPRIVSPNEVGKDAYWAWNDDDWAIAEEDALYLYPCLRGREYVKRINGMFVFSTDGFPMMGPTKVPGFWTCVGIWVTHAGGAGKAIAEWMAQGTTEWDMREADVNRFHRHQQTKHYIHIRTAQNYREVYDIIHPLEQMREPRQVRLTPYHARLQTQKGHFFTVAGWEAAQWYGENARLLEKYEDQIPERSGWEARFWSRIQGAEHLAVREHGGLFNISTFTKIEVAGAGALAYLERLAANKIEQPVGKVVYTSLLNERGGIKADLTVTRLDQDRFLMLTGAGTGPADLYWLNSHAPDDGSVVIRDLTSTYTGVGLWGPQARAVLQSVADEDVSNEAFPYFTAQPITVGTIPAYALRLSYAGELGWEIYCRTEFGLPLWDVLWEAGRPFDLIALGNGGFNSLRLEKGYRAFGAELHTDYDPYEAGLGWAVRLHKGNFIGREALLQAKEQGLARKLCCMTFDEPEGMAMGKEPIFNLDGETLGYVTSADYGYSVGKFIVYGYLPAAYVAKGTQVQIQYFDRRYRATVTADPLFDAEMTRLKG